MTTSEALLVMFAFGAFLLELIGLVLVLIKEFNKK